MSDATESIQPTPAAMRLKADLAVDLAEDLARDCYPYLASDVRNYAAKLRVQADAMEIEAATKEQEADRENKS